MAPLPERMENEWLDANVTRDKSFILSEARQYCHPG
jgi:hypothetical protein